MNDSSIAGGRADDSLMRTYGDTLKNSYHMLVRSFLFLIKMSAGGAKL